MFTGLVETCGTLRRIEPRGPGTSLAIAAPEALVAELTVGDSLAVDGACLTVTSAAGDTFKVDASAETMRCTTLGDRKGGDPVHLERALAVGDRLGGHLVAGHVDAAGAMVRSRAVGASLEVWFSAPQEVARYLVPKGSVAIDGVSLTVNEVAHDVFSVMLIPHTQTVVHLHLKRPGDRVNLEADLVGKYVERLLEPHAAARGIDLEALQRTGFMES